MYEPIRQSVTMAKSAHDKHGQFSVFSNFDICFKCQSSHRDLRALSSHVWVLPPGTGGWSADGRKNVKNSALVFVSCVTWALADDLQGFLSFSAK